MKKNKIIAFFAPSIIVGVLVLGIILYPNEAIKSAREGFSIWSNVLVPSLLPFIIGANLIVDLKIVDIIGFIINPITRFVFNVSGKSALAFAISTVSGYPVGVSLASEFRSNGQISKYEAQRLVSFCSTSGPLFIIGSVGTGMFQNSNLGYLMILCHYLGTILVGLFFRNYGNENLPKTKLDLKTSIKNVINIRNSSGNGFFVLFGNAVFNGVNTLLTVGGFVIVFSVVFKILSLFNVISLIASVIYLPLSFLGVSKELCQAFVSGLFEITIGCNKVSSITSSPEILRASLASFLIGFSGLSILAQCCTFLSKTDIDLKLYILSKFAHGVLAAIFIFILYPIANSAVLVSSFADTYNVIYNNLIWFYYLSYYDTIIQIVVIIYLISAVFIAKKHMKTLSTNGKLMRYKNTFFTKKFSRKK